MIGPNDPPPYVRVNDGGKAPILLVCDHASCAVPEAMDKLGLPSEALQDHIGWDIGAAEVTRRMAECLDAPAVLAGYSRLVIDCNRPANAPDAAPAVSDEVFVPGNQDLSADDIEARRQAFFWPYHAAIGESLDAMLAAGQVPAFVAMHSYTPRVSGGVPRPWHAFTCWDRDPRMAKPVLEALRAGGLIVGDNEPYAIEALTDYTIPEHGLARGLPHVLIEIRNDQIRDAAGIDEWAERLCRVLRPVLALPENQRIQHFD